MIYKLTVGDLNANCYIISQGDKCILIDAGDDYDKINNFINKNKLNVLAILLTHGHFDHCASCSRFQKQGIPVYIHKLDEDKLYTEGNLSNMISMNFEKFKADVLIEEGILKIGEFEFEVLHTPGHSEGGVCYIYKNNIFCGDTIFENGIGRYDFYDGSYIKLLQSINKLIKYKSKQYIFYYGH